MLDAGSQGAQQIDLDRLRAFTALSGDHNPIHVDPVAARRLAFGGIVIHGVLVLLDALGDALDSLDGPVLLTRLKASFSAPIFPGDGFRTVVKSATADQIRLRVDGRHGRCQTIRVGLSPAGEWRESAIPDEMPPVEAPQTHSLVELPGLSGEIPLQLARARAAALFPRLTARLPRFQIASLVATTRVIGMQNPGLHSIFTGLDLTFEPARPNALATLAYRTERVDERFGLVSVAVSGPGVAGTLEGRFRAPPVAQIGLNAARRLVPAGRYAGVEALVVGGSRGLGEAAAKLIGAGGGRCRLTYAVGRADAERVAAELTAASMTASVHHFDALASDPAVEPAVDSITHVLYFASPFITLNPSGNYDDELHDRFAAVYAGGLEHLVERLLDGGAGSGPLTLFFASTAFLDNPEPAAAEYTAAKADGEAMVRALAARHGAALSIAVARLPRLLSDQTAGVDGLSPEENARTLFAALDPVLTGES